MEEKGDEKPCNLNTFSKLSASDNESKDDSHAQLDQKQLSNSPHASEDMKEKRHSAVSVAKDSVLSHGHCCTCPVKIRNKLEEQRRKADLKECFEALKMTLPEMDVTDGDLADLYLLRGAIRFIQILKRKDRTYQHDLECEKVAFRQRLSLLKERIASQLDPVDVK